VASRGRHHKTFAIISADGARPAHSNSRRNARSSKAAGERGSAPKITGYLAILIAEAGIVERKMSWNYGLSIQFHRMIAKTGVESE